MHIGQIQVCVCVQNVYLVCVCCVCCVCCPTVCSFVLSSLCALLTRGQGLTFTSARVLVPSSAHRWARRSQPTNTVHRDHSSVKSVLSCPHQPDDHRMSVIAKKLGCLLRLTNAARLGLFFGSSMARRTLPLGLFTAATSIRKLCDNFPSGAAVPYMFQRVFSAPPGV